MPDMFMNALKQRNKVIWCAGAGAQIALTTNLSRWMLVPNSMVNLDGSVCNMVGTGYTAFYAQSVSQANCRCTDDLTVLMH